MARKTRNQILDKRRQIFNAFERIDEHLQGIEDLADGRSEVVNEMMIYCVLLVDKCKDGLRDMLSKL